MSSEPVIEVRGVAKSYLIYNHPQDRLKQMLLPRLARVLGREGEPYFTEHWALRDIDFAVAPGETVGIIGRNGSGKSTLLQIICGTLQPTLGEVRVRGRIGALLELGAGFNPEFTGRQNAVLNAQILGLSVREIADRMAAIEAFANIGAFFDHAVKTYSSGMFVRVAFAVQAHVEPDILLVDEALAVGDAAFQAKCLSRIRHLQEQGTSILLVSHSAGTLIEFCDRALYIDKGVVRLNGPCRDVVELYSNDIVESENGIQRITTATASNIASEGVPLVSESDKDAIPETEIVSVHILDGSGRPKQAFALQDDIVIEAEVRFHSKNDKPCFGIQISSVDGIPLYSTTTDVMMIKLSSARTGERRIFRWLLKASFGGARYVLSLGVGDVSSGEYRRHHRLTYAGHFDIVPEPHSGYGWLAPNARFENELAIDFRSARAALSIDSIT